MDDSRNQSLRAVRFSERANVRAHSLLHLMFLSGRQSPRRRRRDRPIVPGEEATFKRDHPPADHEMEAAVRGRLRLL